MDARFYMDALRECLEKTSVSAQVMFSQDDGMVHCWGDGWAFAFTPGPLPLEILAFGTAPTDVDFEAHVLANLRAWAVHFGTLSPMDRTRLQRFKRRNERDFT